MGFGKTSMSCLHKGYVLNVLTLIWTTWSRHAVFAQGVQHKPAEDFTDRDMIWP